MREAVLNTHLHAGQRPIQGWRTCMSLVFTLLSDSFNQFAGQPLVDGGSQHRDSMRQYSGTKAASIAQEIAQ